MDSEWIPVAERLPEVEQDTLCHFDDGFIATATYNPNLRGWEVWADAGEVTHWMPLPEPPKEGGEVSDYISREAALASMLDFADFYCDETQGAAECVMEYISAIPAADVLESDSSIPSEDVYTREEVGAMIWRALHALGGADASDDYTKGWDAAITAAIHEVEKLTGVDGDQLGDKLLDEIEIEVDSL